MRVHVVEGRSVDVIMFVIPVSVVYVEVDPHPNIMVLIVFLGIMIMILLVLVWISMKLARREKTSSVWSSFSITSPSPSRPCTFGRFLVPR